MRSSAAALLPVLALLAVAWVAAIALPRAGADEPPPAAPPAPEAVEGRLVRKVLPNGLTIILKESHKAPILTMQVWCKAGSVHEGRLLGSGMSHFVEHMLFKGTKKLAVGEFAQRVKAAGGDLNAYTNFEQTVFHINIRSEWFDQGLEALSDVIMNSSFDPAETTKEMEVIVKELESYEDDPDRRLYTLFNATAYQVHPYRHPIGGYIKQFRQLTREDLVAYYHEQYVPGNLVFLAVGDFDIDAALPKVEAAFQEWLPRPVPAVYVPEEPAQIGRRDAVDEMNGIETAKVKWGWHSVSISDPDLYAMDVAAFVLGYGRSSRLSQIVKDRLGLVTDIGASSHTPLYRGIFNVWATLVDPAKLAETEAAVMTEIERLKNEPVTAAEIDRAKTAVAANLHFGRQTVEDEAGSLGNNEIMSHNLDFDRLYVERLGQVTAEEIRRVARKYFTTDNLTCAVVRPKSSAPTVAAGAASVSKEAPTRLVTLSNGLKLILRRNPEQPIVSATAAFLAGVRFEPADRNGVSNFMARLVTRGTKTRSAEEIALAVESVGGSLKAQGGRNSFMVSTDMLKEHFPLGLELMADVIQNPTFPQDQVDKVRVQLVSGLKQEMEDVQSINSRLFNRLLYGTHPYSRMPDGTIESVSTLTRDDIVAYHSLVIRPETCVIAIAGDIDLDETQARVEKAFGGLTRATTPLPAVPPVAAITQPVSETGYKDGRQLGSAVLGFPTVDLRNPDRYPLEVAAAILTGLGGRLFEEIRGRQALAYNVGCYSAVQLDPGYFAFYILTTPQNVDPAMESMRAEIRKIQETGVTDEELLRGRNYLIGNQIGDLQTNASQAQSMALDELYGLGYRDRFEYAKRIEAVTKADLLRVAKAYFVPEKAVLAITRPPAANAAPATR